MSPSTTARPGTEIPRWPKISVTLNADGTGLLTNQGRDHRLNAADIDAARADVIARVVATARSLERPVRLKSTDPDGEWELAVHPDGTVTELDEQTRSAGTRDTCHAHRSGRCANPRRGGRGAPGLAHAHAATAGRRTSPAARRPAGSAHRRRARTPALPRCSRHADPHQRPGDRRQAADRFAAKRPARSVTGRQRERQRRRRGQGPATPASAARGRRPRAPRATRRPRTPRQRPPGQ